ncbi:uncharacterized protein [Parasteatoda tepidariorum]|uniref:uncharacterized protein n=1 Tax=Parasteatoda tepidariorum TaxID=114398 RepID=UPI001C718E8E|nr:uncharacterized protein LOC107437585 [Parasteatoda tepidariorum]
MFPKIGVIVMLLVGLQFTGSEGDLSTVKNCFAQHLFQFQDCYYNIDVVLNKSFSKLSKKELTDYKCTLSNSLYDCVSFKAKTFCNEEGNEVNDLIHLLSPSVETKCNKTGVILGQASNYVL